MTASMSAGFAADQALADVLRAELDDLFAIDGPLQREVRSFTCGAIERATEGAITLRLIRRDAVDDPRLVERFQAELTSIAALDHPHLLRVAAFGVTPRLLWYATRRREDRTLRAVLADGGPLPWPACRHVAEQVASALHHAHRHGVVHGDVRPDRIVMDDRDWVRVTDFGLARLLDGGPAATDVQARRLASTPPEADGAWSARPADDQYGLACCVHECLTGRAPFAGTSPSDLAARKRRPPDEVTDRPDVPREAARAIRKALDPDPANRFATTLEFMAALSGAAPAGARPDRPAPGIRAPHHPVLLFRPPFRSAPWLRLGGLVVMVVGLGAMLRVTPHAPVTVAPSAVRPAPSMEAERVAAAPPVTAPPAPEPDTTAVPPVEPDPPAPPLAAPRAARRATPPPPPPAVARLFIGSRPWGRLYVDGQLIGNTPRADLPIAPGTHVLHVSREGFVPFDTVIHVAPGSIVRLGGIVLRDPGS